MFCFTNFCYVTLLATSLIAVNGEEACSEFASLGTPSWARFDGKVDISVDDDSQYTWTISFKHDDSLPVPDDPAVQCNPTVDPPAIATDGLPYFAFRWHYELVPDYFEKATGINHISIDYNPCGHPPVDVFTIPHYDFHTYRVTREVSERCTDFVESAEGTNPAHSTKVSHNCFLYSFNSSSSSALAWSALYFRGRLFVILPLSNPRHRAVHFLPVSRKICLPRI